MSETQVYERVCAVDVAKETLEIELSADAWHQSLATGNDAAGFAQLISLCRQHAIQIVVMEATGGYERALTRALTQAGIAVAVVNPSRIRFFALSLGLLAKTDRIDARLIARFARQMVLQPTAARSALQEELLALTGRKAQLLEMQSAEQNRLQQQSLPRLNVVAKEEGIKKIYLLDIKEMRTNKTPEYMTIFEKVKDHVDFTEGSLEKQNINVPNIIVIKNGQIIGSHMATVTSHVKDENSVLPPMTAEQETEYKNIVRDLLEQIK
jgi:transposase